jgi:uncharacterized lipoprotein YmbA
MRKFAILLPLVLLAACSSAPTHFYQLDAKAPEAAVTHRPTLVKVTSVSIPRLLDRDQIVRSTGSEQVELGTLDHWAAPLDALFQQSLTQDLVLRLPAGSVIPANATAGAPVLTIAVDVMKFEGDAAGHITLDAFWSAAVDPQKPITTHTEHIQLTANDATYAGLTDGMSQAVGVLADRIAAELP